MVPRNRFGTGVTGLQSSITTSVLIPFAGAGALMLPQIYPLSLAPTWGDSSVIGAMDKAELTL
jgi:hypothetical protein